MHLITSGSSSRGGNWASSTGHTGRWCCCCCCRLQGASSVEGASGARCTDGVRGSSCAGDMWGVEEDQASIHDSRTELPTAAPMHCMLSKDIKQLCGCCPPAAAATRPPVPEMASAAAATAWGSGVAGAGDTCQARHGACCKPHSNGIRFVRYVMWAHVQKNIRTGS
jgi:hypothetical protein